MDAPWRLMLSPALPGTDNMALDEALLESVAAKRQPPTLRLYHWEPACLSLGHAQPVEDADLERLRTMGWDLVRRTTGGRAILHIDELTYSVTAPTDHRLLGGGVLPSYRRLSRGLLAGLELLGVRADAAPGQPQAWTDRTNPVCFEAPSAYEITAGGRKLIGSAQRRRAAGVLQHGSLPLCGDLGRICSVLVFRSDGDREAAAARVRLRATTLEQLLGRRVPWEQAAESLVSGFAQALGLHWTIEEPDAEERARALVLRSERFAANEWTARGSRR
jgi:lipoyl(octanoyl) transferase